MDNRRIKFNYLNVGSTKTSIFYRYRERKLVKSKVEMKTRLFKKKKKKKRIVAVIN